MSIFEGGVFSRARGKVGGLVFSEASTRQGKRQTVRELVKPHDPRTPSQMLARQAQSDSSEVVRLLNNLFQMDVPGIPGTFSNEIYRKAVGQLSGFQSLKSVILSARDLSSSIVEFSETPAPTVAGNLHTPVSVEFTPQSPTSIQVSWSTELGINGSPNDTVITGLVCINRREQTGLYAGNFDGNGEGRSNGMANISVPTTDASIEGWLVFFTIVSTSGTRVTNRGTYIYSQQSQPLM